MNGTAMKDIINFNETAVKCVCKVPTKIKDEKCFSEDQYDQATIINELLCFKTGKAYNDKTQI